ncbi:MAG: nickel pincer cofactor biosynthesis protein LarB [Lachnospiraceae bacterium]|nr:nickel pincer cofactor biosynthesis protein LarB [Lachnospiraceae bacterium]MBQ9563940.1 nickel pincer cofactor biosynthesis protein LarB [Lachnospiraceae bacterium]MBQ9592796.1 nickel pincer cofactor biosynthesis protein LarB [Lachnospiraceae bacterium]
MYRDEILKLLEDVRDGAVAPEEALTSLKMAPFDDLGYAKVDVQREVRQGIPEVIYGAGKTTEQILGIVASMRGRGREDILITRLSAEAAEVIAREIPLEYHKEARIGIAWRREKELTGCVVVACGGTSDIPVCEEAALTAELFGNRVVRLYDVGVSGLHRLLSNLEILAHARVVVAAAGMEGALASVIGGLVDCPVIAVPTSVGYGANFHGLSALLSMLNSCASGVSVVNIDNGFGAGYLAGMINKIETAKN